MPNITTYDFIDENRRKTILLMALFPITLVVLVYLAIILFSLAAGGGQHGNYQSPLDIANQTAMYVLPIVSAIAILWILISYFFGQNFIISTAGAVEITRETAPEIIKIVEDIAITAGLPMPKVYAINDDGMNAFATGRDPEHSYVVLTKGLVNNLEKSELEGVIAHEMAHIGNRDIRTMLIMIVCISFATIAAQILLRLAWVRRGGKNNAAQLLLFALAMALYIYGYLVAPLLKLAVSRTREFQADATAALITRNPQGLIGALRKISGKSTVETLKDKETMSAMCIETPLSKEKQNSFFSKFSGLLSTHPPIEARIKALEVMDGNR
ncbi:MAG: M48 family metallopeptidase [Endomicrobia bacterium]|nr:M48 family metallopeptidase [Endomicrobiia bacterium]MCL2798658.1 M48 family metallopeptidase [Endomicrobiia bacterium]